jgi:hypothetical protein
MKKNQTDRILGRRLAREIPRERLAGAAVPGGVNCWSLSDPPDGPFHDH